MLRIYYQTVETNGQVRMLNSDVYGCEAHQVEGLKAQVLAHARWIGQATTVLKVFAVLVTLALSGGIVGLFL